METFYLSLNRVCGAPQSLAVLFLGIETLAGLETVEGGDGDERIREDSVLVHRILNRYAFTDAEVDRSIREIAEFARVVQRDYDGHVQRFLRTYAREMSDDLVSGIEDGTLSEQSRRYAVTRWLQNAANMPLSMEHEAIAEFCRQENVDVEDLYDAVDDPGWTMTFVDDMLQRCLAETQADQETLATND